jgi:hypothetical protein
MQPSASFSRVMGYSLGYAGSAPNTALGAVIARYTEKRSPMEPSPHAGGLSFSW